MRRAAGKELPDADAERPDNDPRARASGRLRPAAHQGGDRAGADAARLCGDAAVGRCLQQRPGLHPAGGADRGQQGRLPARQFRLRQEPLHGGAQPAVGRQHAGALDPRAGRCRGAPQLDARPQVPARAVSHDRRARHGIRHPRPVRRVRAQETPKGAGSRLLPRRGPVQGCARTARTHGRRALLRAVEQARWRRRGRWRLGRVRQRLGRCQLRSSHAGAAEWRGAFTPRRRPDHTVLLGIPQLGRQWRVFRLARRWPEHHEPPRSGAGLRRGDPVPG